MELKSGGGLSNRKEFSGGQVVWRKQGKGGGKRGGVFGGVGSLTLCHRCLGEAWAKTVHAQVQPPTSLVRAVPLRQHS